MNKKQTIYLRNTSGSTISFAGAARTFSIPSSSNATIWDPKSEVAFLNFSNILEQEWIFARDVGSGDLAMYINGVEQTSDVAFSTYHQLKTYYNSMDGYEDVFNSIVTPINDGQIKLNSTDDSPGYISTKLIAGTNITISEQASALMISSTGGTGSGNSFSTLTDGTNNAIASGEDTFRFRSANNLLTTLVTPSEATYGDNLLLTINQANFDHGSISGLTDDDHTQYLLVNGTRSMSGSLNMNSNNITNVGTVGGYTLSTFVPNTITITAGAGLTGGGTLASNRTLDVVANADGSIVVNADNIQVGVISDSQHGARSGGTTHAVATTSVNGFMSSTDKTKLDGISSGAQVNPNIWSVFSDGTNTASPATTSDTFRFRSANNILTTIVGSNDGTYGDNLLLTINQSNIDHGSIGGLTDDDHTQYLLVNGTRAMSGTLNMNSNNITNVGTVGGYTLSTFVPNTITITAGAGLTGGGTLASNRTLDVVANADGSIVVNADNIQVGVISDAQHGTRGGGTTHAIATTSVNGFMSSTDKTKLDQIINNSHRVTISATQPPTASTGDIWIVIA